jgi:hypothetical protein
MARQGRVADTSSAGRQYRGSWPEENTASRWRTSILSRLDGFGTANGNLYVVFGSETGDNWLLFARSASTTSMRIKMVPPNLGLASGDPIALDKLAAEGIIVHQSVNY